MITSRLSKILINRPVGFVCALLGGYCIWFHLSAYMPTARTIAVPIFLNDTQESTVPQPTSANVTFVGPRKLLQKIELTNPSIQVPHDSSPTINLEPCMVLCNTAVEPINIYPSVITISRT